MDNMELLAIQEDDQNSLEHYGVKGQKWGQRNYQNLDGTYTELGKERRRVAFIKEEKAKKESEANAHQNGIEESIDTDTKIGGKAYKDMTRKELRQAKKRARHNEALRREKREFNKEKRQALEEGDLAFISQNISKFTNDELDQAVVRYNKMQNLRTLENVNKKDSGYYADKAIKWLERGDRASRAFTSIVNNFNDMSKKSAEKQKTQTELSYLRNPASKPLTEKEKVELEYLRDPSKKPLTEADQIKNDKSRSEYEQTRIDTEWKSFTDAEKRKDYDSMTVKDFKEKWGSYDSGGGKGKGGGDSSGGKGKGKKPNADDFYEKAKNTNWDDPDEAKKTYEEFFSGQHKNSIGNWFSKKDKDKINKDSNKDFDLDSKEINRLTEKYLGKLKESNKDYFKVGSVRDDQWKKDLKKHDSDVIDKWVKDMKKKYMKERNMDSKAAEEKAEAYVDSWLNSYDEELLKEIQSMR